MPKIAMFRNAYLLLLLTTLFWAGNAIAGKMAVGHVSPMILTAARWGFTVVILAFVGWRHLLADWLVIRKRSWFLLAAGTLGFTLFSVAMYCALLYTSATNVSIEQGGIPLVVFIASFLLFRTRTTRGQILGFALSFCGVIVAATHGEIQRLVHLEMNFGDALMLIAITTQGIYTVVLRRKPQVHWITLMVGLCLGAFLSAVPFVAAEAAIGATILPDAKGWGIITYVVLFPSLIAQATYIRGVELIGANRAGLFVNFLPLWGALLAVLLLNEAFQFYHAVALVLVLGGVLIAEHSGRKIAASQL
jgi:drug/metabolite transporter (DMT)-like permease